MSTRRSLSLALLGAILTASPAMAQTAAPQAKPGALASPNAETPPGGIARGVVPPPRGMDPGMVAKPPVSGRGTMPVIPPPAAAR